MVKVRLRSERGGTRVEAEHRDLATDEAPGHASGWRYYLTRLAAVAHSGDAGPDPAHEQ